MVKYGIKIFARIKPTNKQTGVYEVNEEEGLSKLSFVIPRSEASGYVNNKKETFNFRFSRVFEQATTQNEIFENVARGVIDNCLEGYNGTIFAYGQTGSGKTFTITGGVEKYSDRGIIPRTLSYLFQQFQKSPGTLFTTHISYLEIYNDKGYDLLDPKHEASKLEDLPKVSLLEDGDGNIHMKNLSMHPATTEEESLNWLFIGDTNRMMAETPMNMASTRSHCIFTVHISSREPGSDTLKKAKLHLVDLAGSERIGKTGVTGTLLNEAKYINLSLHSLEQVIVALSEKSRSHIPYRNSMMTSVLRDSLGGNCMTTMIATCSVEKKNIEETISTCRLSQRVALVKNEAVLNEELDPKLMVARLRTEIQELKDELSLATGEQRTDDLTDEEKEKCRKLVEQFIADIGPESRLIVGGDMRMIQLAFQLLKAEILKIFDGRGSVVKENSSQRTSSDETGPSEETPQVDTNGELLQLRDLLQQRDDEISVLLKMLKQEKRRAADAEASLKKSGGALIKPSSPIMGRTSPLQLEPGAPPLGLPSPSQRGGVQNGVGFNKGGDQGVVGNGSRDSVEWAAVSKAALSQARQEAFDMFRKSIADMSTVEKHRKILKAKYAEAKSLGERVNTSRLAINKLKGRIEKLRISRGVQGLTEGSLAEGPDLREEELKTQIEGEKASFKVLYGQLKELKTEIEHLQHLHEKAKLQVQRDFEQWWEQQTQRKDGDSASAKTAWRTPPSSVTPSHHTPTRSTSITPSNHTSKDRGPPSQHRSQSRHSQRILAAKFSSQPPSNDIVRPTSGHQIKLPNKEDGPFASGGSRSGLESSSGWSKDSQDSSRPSNTGNSTSGISSIEAMSNESYSGPKDRQPDSLSSLIQSSHGSSFERLLTRQKPLFNQHRTISNRSEAGRESESIPLTGDPRADADIIAFYKARQKLIQKGHSNR